MIKRLLLLGVIITQVFCANAQLNMNLVGQLTFPGKGDLSDIWGYKDTASGKEYALVGTFTGTSIVDISTPSAPVEVFFSPGANSIWRDLKVWNKHVYITNEQDSGMKIIDMSNLPGPITTGDVSQYKGSTYPFTSAHDLYIDENGYAYIMGANHANGGAIILDLTVDPKNPVEVGLYDDYYLHDGMARGDTLWGGAINDGFLTAVDVSNKANPVTMATHVTPSSFTHNVWVSDDGDYVFTTDEKSNAFLGAYDVSNLANITEVDRIQSNPGSLVIPHNTFVHGDYLVTSYYRDGVTVHDISNPSIMVEVGNYDTSPQFAGNGFNGCWGVYPYLPSGLVIASDIENGLFVLGPNYTPASYLDGNVTDTVTTNPIDAVQVDIVSTTTSTNTNILGDYQTGIATAGTYSVSFTKLGYKTKTINNVVLTATNTTTVNVELVPLVPFTLQGQVLDVLSNPIANAEVRIIAPSYDVTVQTNAGGNFSIPGFIEGSYDVYIGHWGHQQLCLANQNLAAASNPHIYQMLDGYYDDFTLDLGWTVSGNPSTGDWEKGVPVGTTSGPNQANPGDDSQSDCLDEAYVTGNGGGGAGNDDIDGGQTVLASPIFDLSTYGDPYIHFDRWFFNAGGSGTPNDSLVISLSNGSSSVEIEVAIESTSTNSTWVTRSVQVSSVITPTSTMQLTVRAMDDNPGHLVEAAFDKFFVDDALTTEVVVEKSENNDVLVFPTPFVDELNVTLKDAYESIKIDVLDISGKLIDSKDFKNVNTINFKNEYSKGVYLINVYGNGNLVKAQKAVKL
jgi:choice-of-anchor B domain-containing protein